jgi:hypothetical protein
MTSATAILIVTAYDGVVIVRTLNHVYGIGEK